MHELALALALFSAPSPLPFGPAEQDVSAAITPAELRAHVHRLASPAFGGRRGPGAARTADYVAHLFARTGLSPAFGDSYFQEIPWLTGAPNRIAGRNVAALRLGTDRRDEWIILSAHYDHLGERNGVLFPGADDNASGVAMLVEVAEAFALGPPMRRTVLFVAFDLEEVGLQGSTHFAAHPPRPFGQLKAFVTADLLGRSMADVMPEYGFVLGSESSPQLRQLVETERPAEPWRVGRLGADLVGTRSDYGPFRDRRVPFLFLTTGTHNDYHRPTDLPDRLDYAKLAGIAQWTERLLRRLADADRAPVWDPKPAREDPDEARTVLTLLERALAKPGAIRESQRAKVTAARDRLGAIVARGTVTAGERQWLLGVARELMVKAF